MSKTGHRHRIVWEAANGPIAAGHMIHHINGDNRDNRVENLMDLTRSEHHLVHAGHRLDGGVWRKRCPMCGDDFPSDHYRRTKLGRASFRSICRSCHNAETREWKHRTSCIRRLALEPRG